MSFHGAGTKRWEKRLDMIPCICEEDIIRSFFGREIEEREARADKGILPSSRYVGGSRQKFVMLDGWNVIAEEVGIGCDGIRGVFQIPGPGTMPPLRWIETLHELRPSHKIPE